MIMENPMTLNELKVSQTARVSALTGDPAIRQRLGEMGLTAGSEVRMVRTAPLGDPIQVNVRDYHLCLRRAEARCVLVDPVTVSGTDASAQVPTTTTGRIANGLKRLSSGAFLFFAIKGMLWLLVPLILLRFA